MEQKKLNRQERVLVLVKEYTSKRLTGNLELVAGISAQEAADLMQLNRANISKELNQLHQMGQLIKSLGKPTRFLHRGMLAQTYPGRYLPTIIPLGEKLTDYLEAGSTKGSPINIPFTRLEQNIGADGSLHTAVEQAKAAICYPPRGLHTLITGSAGVGKIRFARLMYEYGVQTGKLEKDAPFITFNCQDYSGSPQLLMAQLFGNSKGSLPGAEKSRKGLIEQAAGGIFYLDGIQKLSPKVQELLVTLMEKNIFSRLGEASVTRYGNLMIVAATTQDISAPELQRFVRNMPVIIHLPDLSERSVLEILQHLVLFFSKEASSTGTTFRIHKDILACLVQIPYSGQIGEMKSRVKIICSKAYLEYSTTRPDSKIMEIGYRHLPDSITKLVTGASRRSAEATALFERFTQTSLLFVPGETPTIPLLEEDTLEKMEYEAEEEPVPADIDHYISRCVSRLQGGNVRQLEKLRTTVPTQLYETVHNTLAKEPDYQAVIQNPSLLYGLILHLQHAVERGEKPQLGMVESNQDIRQLNPKEYAVACRLREEMEENLGVRLPDRELNFVATYLYLALKWSSSSRIGVLVVHHGEGIAEGLAEYLNAVTGCALARGISFGGQSTMEHLLNRLATIAKECDQGSGLLLMTDMEPLTDLHRHITAVTGIKAQTVSGANLSQMLLLADKIRQGGFSLATLLSESWHSPLPQQEMKAEMPTSSFLNRIINEILATSLTFLNPRKAADVLLEALDFILDDLKLGYSDEIALKFIFHCSHMLERVIRSETLKYPRSRVFLNENSPLMYIIQQRMSYVGDVFGILIPIDELCYVAEIFMPFLGNE
ncbi:sigma 54-interacting transcriptional regulator [Oscillospiraceae bacterium LTW-04]|nr:sigma 54-interacting transcriptional regulator [Oscillospiraceae bacterium MB24-C1]